MFENKALRNIFGAKRDEITRNGESYIMLSYIHCILHLTKIRNLTQRRLRWAGHVARMEESDKACRVLVGSHVGRRPRHRWEDNIKIDLKEVGYDTRNWMYLAKDRQQCRTYLRSVMNLRVH